MNPKLFIAIPIFLFLDFGFLFFNRAMLQNQIFQIQHRNVQPKIEGAFACYFFLFLALFYFILRDHRSPLEAGILGFTIYGVFETTCYSMLEKWKIETVFIDIVWGTTLFFLTTLLTYSFIDLAS